MQQMARHLLDTRKRVFNNDAHNASTVLGVGGQINGHCPSQRSSEQANLIVIQVVARQQIVERGSSVIVQSLLGWFASRLAIATVVDHQYVNAAAHNKTFGVL